MMYISYVVHIPLEIRRRGSQSVEAFLKALREGKAKNNHCNLVVLGEARVGKTSLIKSLLGLEFDPDCKSTHGVCLEEIDTLVERVDIQVPDSMKRDQPWKTVEPLKRARQHYHDAVANAVEEADPHDEHTNTRQITETIPTEEKLMGDVLKVLKRLSWRDPPAQDKKFTTRRKKRNKAPLPPNTGEHRHKTQPTAGNRQQHKDRVDKPPPNEHRKPRPEKTNPQPLEEPATKKSRESISYTESKDIVKRLKSSRADSAEKLIFHAIDFAGQPLYRPMHHCFLTHRAIYIVVFNLQEILSFINSQRKEDKDPFIEIRYWLNNIIAHAENTDPKIFLIGTHRNPPGVSEISDKDLSLIDNEIQDKFIKDKKEQRYLHSIQYCGENIVLPVENSMTNKGSDKRAESGISQVMVRLLEVKTDIPFLCEYFPANWIKLEQKLLEMQDEQKHHPLLTTRADVENWARECGITDDEQIKAAIQFYHDIRVIIDQSKFKSHYISQWMVSFIHCISEFHLLLKYFTCFQVLCYW